MKKIIFILALIIAGTASAQELTKELTIALKNNDATALAQLVTDNNKNACLKAGRSQRTLLQLAVQMNGTETVDYLLKTAEVDANQACGGMTPLMWASKYGKLDTATALLAAGADASIKVDGKTALDLAKEKKKTALVNLLSK